MTFVDYVRVFRAENDYNNLELAINHAIDRCIMEGVLKDFLLENRSEVVKVTKLDYTFDRQIELEREDARETGLAEGRELGRAEGRELAVFCSVKEGDYSAERGAQKLNMTIAEFVEKMKKAGLY